MPKQTIGSKLYNSPYILDKFLAQGGMNSEIYLCHNANHPNKKLVAKIVTKPESDNLEEFVTMFHEEAITSLRLSNKENLVQTYEFFNGKDQSEVIIIQDYVDGISLQQFIEKKGFLTPRVALSIFKQILIGVKSLHNFTHQIIHCDLKPENIMISKDLSKVTIIDFGISSVLEKNKEKHVMEMITREQDKGTEGYVSPDIYKKITVQHDFYSLGAILYMMIMREHPFKIVPKKSSEYLNKLTPAQRKNEEAKRVRQTVTKALIYDISNISSNSTIPVALENLIFRCLACKPDDLKYRYNDISEIIDDVNRIINQIDHKINDDKLLKPLEKRTYEVPDNIVIDRLEKRNKIFQQWWFAFVIIGCTLIFIIIALVVTFVIK